MLEQHTLDKLHKIRHMLLTDEHTRSHWLFWTVMSEVTPYIARHFEELGLEVPCGSAGCAIGHAQRLGIVSTDDFIAARDELGMSQDEYHYIFENGTYGRDYDTPEDVVARIDEILADHQPAYAPDGAMEVTDA